MNSIYIFLILIIAAHIGFTFYLSQKPTTVQIVEIPPKQEVVAAHQGVQRATTEVQPNITTLPVLPMTTTKI